MIKSTVVCLLFFVALPLIYGQIWKNVIDEKSIAFSYISGFLTLLAMFEILGPMMVSLELPVHVQVIVDTITLAVVACVVVCIKREILLCKGKYIRLFDGWKNVIKQLSCAGWFYLILLGVLLLLQIYFAVFYDIGTMRTDDGVYSVISSSAIYDDKFGLTDTVTGVYISGLYKKYAYCGIYMFYTYASYMTGLSVSIIEYSICSVLFLLMAYGAFYLISKYIFSREEDSENRLLFLLILSILYLFGLYSHYSLSFRLFGVIWQGKGFLAVVVTPFLLAVYPRLFLKDVKIKDMLFCIVLSLAAVSLTMGGIITMVALPGIITLLHLIQKKEWKKCVLVYGGSILFPLIESFLYLKF